MSGDERFLDVALVGDDVRSTGAQRFLDGAAFFADGSRVGRIAF